MTRFSGPTTHTARTAKTCHWCGEQIEQEQLFVQWTDGKFWAIKVHPECHTAWQTLPPDERHEVYQGEFSRGCKCEQGHCKCGRQPQTDIDNTTDTEGGT